jgi:hypothetical protein
MSKQHARPGYYTTWQLKERGWSKKLVTEYFGAFQDYYPSRTVDAIETTSAWYTASAEHSALTDAKRTTREDYNDRVDAGELLSRAQLKKRGWHDLVISEHLPRHLRTLDYVAALEARLGIAPRANRRGEVAP